MRTWLERHVERCTTCVFTGSAQRDDFGVRLTVPRVVSFADDRAVGNDDGADHWVRRRLSPSEWRERECSSHVNRI